MTPQMLQRSTFIIDFDSTFVTCEGLDVLAEFTLARHPQKRKLLQTIKDITKLGMEGELSFPESLKKRLALIKPTQRDIQKTIRYLTQHITPSVQRNKEFFFQYSDHIYIISGGFKEYIAPVTKNFGVKNNHILANSFLFDRKGQVIGFDTTNPLAKEHGKVQQLQQLYLQGEVYIVGDGYTDWEVKRAGIAKKFFLFTENVERNNLKDKADATIKSFDEFLFILTLPRAESYPKTKIKVLLLEHIDAHAVEQFESEGYKVTTVSQALSEKELLTAIEDTTILGIRSKTEITDTVLQKAKKLLVIGAFCIGTNQIQLQTAAKKGIAVFNAPYSNTRSVVELVLGEIIMLLRNIFPTSQQMHQGIWHKSATGNHEIRGKKLGIIGYGNIGSQLSVLAENIGMDVYFYDTTDKLALGNVKKCHSLQELLALCDVVSVHVDGRKTNKHLITEKEFSYMKPGAVFLNVSRGHIVDLMALATYIKNGSIAGAAIDVFLAEPASNADPFVSELQNLPNVILTPHIGGSTEEAQRDIADFVANKIIRFINTGNTMQSVNFPEIQLPPLTQAHRFLHIHRNIPGVLAKINNVLAKNQSNIVGQYLKTNEDIGYVITDVNKKYSKKVTDELKQIDDTIRFRILY